MSHEEYQNACAAIDNRPFDDAKKIVAEQVAVGGRLSSTQVAGMLRLFSFESTRLEFAKFAYAYVVDPYNYYLVNDGFSFSSSVEELEAHMSMTAVSGYVVETQGSYGINAGAEPGCGTGTIGVNGFYGGYPGVVLMSEVDFNQLLCAVERKTFDREQLVVARQGIGHRWVSAYMVKRLMDVFAFDDTRLALAKHAYEFCYDKHNYYLVNDAFTFSSSTRELDSFIRHYR